MNDPWASAARGLGAVILEGFGLSDAPAAVKCAAVGHPWPLWEFTPGDAPGRGVYHRRCPGCDSREATVEWAWHG